MAGMRVELASEPGDPDRPNEDFAAVSSPAGGTGGALVVLDGVTPPAGEDGCRHGVPWYVTRLGGGLLELSASHPARPLAECLALAVRSTAEAHNGRCDLSHPRTPQATVVAARWTADEVEYLVLSDSVLLLDRGRSVEPVLDDRLHRLPDSVRVLCNTVRGLPDGSPERASAAAEYVAAVEALRNGEGGFYTAAADPSVADRAVVGRADRAGVRAVAALTDGATRLVEVFRTCDWADTAALLRDRGPAELIARVRAAERAAPDRRGKLHDDATAVLVRW